MASVHSVQDFVKELQRSGEVAELLQSLGPACGSLSTTSLCQALEKSWDNLQLVATSEKLKTDPHGTATHSKDSTVAGKVNNTEQASDDSLFWAQVAIDYAWEQLHTGYWADVHPTWRKAYALGALLKSLNLALCGGRKGRREEAIAELDKGLLLGVDVMENALQRLTGVLMARQSTVKGSRIGKVRFRNYKPSTDSGESHVCVKKSSESEQSRMTCDINVVPLIDMAKRIPVQYCPSLADFRESHMVPSVPVVLSGAMDHWPAYAEKKWSLSYLKDVAGLRTVPVELGSRYTDHDWSQKLMTLADFIDNHVAPSSKEDSTETVKAYLAQHQLFDQIPELREDIAIPDYCCLRTKSLPSNSDERTETAGPEISSTGGKNKLQSSESLGEMVVDKSEPPVVMEGVREMAEVMAVGETRTAAAECEERCPAASNVQQEGDIMEVVENVGSDDSSHVKINCWFGPMGTVSPLHFDPEHNLLAQVVGRKYVRLYGRDQTPYLYPHAGLLTNTSQVDVECPDLSKFPEFARAEYTEFTLHPGQMLYIPPQCWHYVRSLDISFSVSFWWS